MKIADIKVTIPPVTPSHTVAQIADLFLSAEYQSSLSIPIVDDKKIVGIINRYQLMELYFSPFGRDLYAKKSVTVLMNKTPVLVDSCLSIAEAGRFITAHIAFPIREDFVITTKDEYSGMGIVLDLLRATEQALSQAHKKLNDSIQYASLIQKAILPDQALNDFLGKNQSVTWLPRDVVGGDFYIFHTHQHNYLLGVIDCAGHGVAGALMTMLARGALDYAITEYGINSPAILLQQMDATLRHRLQHATTQLGLAVAMDAGLIFIDTQQQFALFAGAKMSLYWIENQQVNKVKGEKPAILGKMAGHYKDTKIAITQNMTFCLTSDGLLDQAGGTEGFGFGNARFVEVLSQNADKSPPEQAAIMMNCINDYRGDYAQRDDMTLLFFKPKTIEDFFNGSR